MRGFLLLIILVLLYAPTGNAEISIMLVSHTSYIDSIGYYHIIGEVENAGSVNLIFVEITATLYDVNDRVVGVVFNFTELHTIKPGEKSPFALICTDKAKIPKIYRYQIEIDFQETTSTPPVKLSIRSYDSYIDEIGHLHIVGEVGNLGDVTNHVKVIVIGYNDTGEVVAVDHTYTVPKYLLQGHNASFEVVVSSERASLIKDYVLIVESDDYQSIVVSELPFTMVIFALSIVSLIVLLKLQKKRIIKRLR